MLHHNAIRCTEIKQLTVDSHWYLKIGLKFFALGFCFFIYVALVFSSAYYVFQQDNAEM